MLIDGDPVAVHEDRSVLDSCAKGTTEADLEIRNEVRDIVVQKLGGPRDPLVKRMMKAAKQQASGETDKAKETMGWD